MNAKTVRSEEIEFERLLEQEKLILAATEMIYELMSKEGVSKADLARAIGKTRGYVTQILDGSRNMTLRTLAEVAFALGHRVGIDARPKVTSKQTPYLVSQSTVHDFQRHQQRRKPSSQGPEYGLPGRFLGPEKKQAVGA